MRPYDSCYITLIGVQLQKEPISLIIEFNGECDTSVTISKLFSCDCDNETIQNEKTTLTNTDWLIISHDLTEALWHVHSKGFLHCDLKSNDVLVSKKHGYIIDFGKACDSSFPTTKKYTVCYPHIAPEVLSTAQKCLDANPARRPTTTGIMATLASMISY